MRYQAVIFDFDGTLCNTLPDLAAAGNYALAQRGYPTHAEEAYRYFVGEGVAKLMRNILPPDRRTDEEAEELREVYREYYRGHSAVKTAPYPGMFLTVKRLCARRIPLCVLSNKDDSDTKALAALYFGDSFRMVYGVRQGHARKPSPDVPLEIAAALGLPPAEILIVGDSKFDILTGKNAGMATCGVLWGFRDREELAAAGADHIIERPEDLLAFF